MIRTLLSILLSFVLSHWAIPLHAQRKSDVTIWQLPSQVNTIGNSYVFKLSNGKVCVMDGGTKDETAYLRGFLAALGNTVDYWFISHPHIDHMGALTEILKKPGDIKIHTICHSALSETYIDTEPQNASLTREFYKALAESERTSGIKVMNFTEPGHIFKLGKTNFKILSVKDESITANPYNNQSMVIRVWDPVKSIVFLGDLGIEGGDKLLSSKYRPELDCEYLQMSHHGNNGVSKAFYRTIKYKACLWPTPSWVYNNDAGKGYNTHIFQTVEIRDLMKELGITRHYVSCLGLTKID